MKTKKVGKIVSLLVAIVLVATIMIPAASVLADNGSNAVTSGINWNGADILTVSGASAYEQLRDYLKNAQPGKPLNIRLDADVSLPTFGVYKDENGDTASRASAGRFYSYATYGVFKDAYKKKEDNNNSWFTSDNPKFGIDEILGRSGSTYGASYDVLDKNPSISTNPYKTVFKFAEPGDTTTRAFLNYDLEGKESFTAAEKERFERLDTAQKKLMAGARGNETLGASAHNDTATYTEYDDAMLCVKEGVTVCLNLNGHKISGLNSLGDPYTGSPNYQTSIFVVRGDLTVVDERVDNAGEEGIITGGTGSIFGKPQYSENSDFNYDFVDSKNIIQGVAYYGVGLGKNAPNEWGDAYIIRLGKKAPDGESWPGPGGNSWGHKVGNYRIYTYYYSRFYANVKETHGGGVYVAPGASFTLLSGKISGNSAWRLNDPENTFIFNVDSNAVACGGGVYVDNGATFTMKGGEISKNAARAYNKRSNRSDATAYGGGVYLASGAVMNMTGGTIFKNATYAETFSKGKTKDVVSEGAGIYVSTGSVCNIMGSADAEGPTTSAMLASFPQITNNSCGAITRNGVTERATVTVKGAGIYCDGILNIKKALVSSNDFSEFSENLAASNILPVKGKATHIMRDEKSGLPLYIYDYNSDGSAKTYVTRLDAHFTENLELATEQVAHETSGIYGTARGNENNKLISDGAGVYLGTTARMNIGERTWITGNYDLVTTGHKAFDNTRNYAKHWEKTANGGAGGYVYTGSESAGISNGFTWSDTSDDVYLPDGVTMYKGDTLFESRIGVNYYDMVDKAGDVSVGATGRASNRVIVKSATDLDYNLWGATTASPLQTDIQFFSLNDNNKNYERDISYNLPPYVNDAKHKEYYGGALGTTARPMDLRGSENGGPALPPGCAPGVLQEDGGWPSKELRDSYLVSVVKASDVEGVIGGTDWTYRKDYLSPYTGYIDFSTKYKAGTTWSVEWESRFKKNKVWPKYNKDTYWMTAADLNPATTAMANKNVVFPQRAYQIDSTASQLSEYEQRAKFMDYKVIYDDNGFGSDAAPVLRFGKGDRQMYVTYNFDEADKTYYGKNVNNQSLNEAINIDNLITSKSIFKIINTAEDGSSFTFYGANRPTGTLVFNKIVPDYKAYKASNVLADRIEKRQSELASITKTDGEHEDKDLYFKGWSFYASYGYGPEIVTLNNEDKLQPIDVDARSGSLDYRGTFTADLSKIFNSNVNAQPCPSMTAIWYTKEELAEARLNISNVKYQIVKRDDGTDLLRAVAIAGSKYEKFNAVGFVISTSNATPTIEGGYDYVTNDTIYERLGVKVNGKQKCYDVDQILGGKYYDEDNGGYHSRIPVEKYDWTFADGTVGGNSTFAANVSTGNYKKGYKDAGLFYTNIIITDDNRNTVYFVTPYAKLDDGTYYYGESRAICYADYIN